MTVSQEVDASPLPILTGDESAQSAESIDAQPLLNKGKYTGVLRGHPMTADAESGDM